MTQLGVGLVDETFSPTERGAFACLPRVVDSHHFINPAPSPNGLQYVAAASHILFSSPKPSCLWAVDTFPATAEIQGSRCIQGTVCVSPKTTYRTVSGCIYR